MATKDTVTKYPKKKDYSWLKPYQFKPGESGNKTGRQYSAVIIGKMIREVGEEIRDESEQTRIQVLIRKLFEMGNEGDLEAIKLIFDRGWGLQSQKLNLAMELPKLATEFRIDRERVIRSPALTAIFRAAGVDLASLPANATRGDTAGATVIENKTTNSDS